MSDSATLALKRYGLDWQPGGGNDRQFYWVVSVCLSVSLLLSIVIANTHLPPAPQQLQAPVSPRIVNFMANRPKPTPPITQPKPVVVPPKIHTRPAPTPVNTAPPPTQIEPEPATASLGRTRPTVAADPNKATARAKAQGAGLLALGAQVTSVLDNAPNTQALTQTANSHSTEAAPTANVTDHLGSTRQLTLTAAPASKAATAALDTQALQTSASDLKQALNTAAAGPISSRAGRSDKDIAGVFAQNQPGLNSLYERARRQIPGLAGKLVLELNIAADGSVSSLKVLTSELNNAELEAKIISRVKLFKFAAGKAQNGVKYAMEFVPG